MDANIPIINPRRVTGPRRNRSVAAAPIPLDLEPATAYEAITRQKVESLENDLAGIKARVDTIFYLVIGSILVDMLSRWISG